MAIRLTTQTLKNMYGQTDMYAKISADCGHLHLETIRRWMRANAPNGPLTGQAILTLISEHLGVPVKYLTEHVNPETEPQRADSAPAHV